jgi:hypothetical protein
MHAIFHKENTHMLCPWPKKIVVNKNKQLFWDNFTFLHKAQNSYFDLFVSLGHGCVCVFIPYFVCPVHYFFNPEVYALRSLFKYPVKDLHYTRSGSGCTLVELSSASRLCVQAQRKRIPLCLAFSALWVHDSKVPRAA